MLALTFLLSLVLLLLAPVAGGAVTAPVPDKLVVLTFDDAVKSHRTFVAPLLKDLGFGATFFVTHTWMNDPTNCMTSATLSLRMLTGHASRTAVCAANGFHRMRSPLAPPCGPKPARWTWNYGCATVQKTGANETGFSMTEAVRLKNGRKRRAASRTGAPTGTNHT
jgi:hypothetical protein